MQSLSSLIVSYLEIDEYEKQLSPDTLKAYRIDLRQFLDFTGGEWADKDMLYQILNQHFAPRSAKRKLASICAFYHEMEISGMDIRYIQSLLGHSSISTTQIYTHVSAKQQTLLLAEKHPRGKMKFSLCYLPKTAKCLAAFTCTIDNLR